VHRDVAVVVEERRRQAAGLALAHRRHAGDIHASGARRGDDQAADECSIGKLIRRYADEVGDDVHVVTGQARRDTGCGFLRRT